MKTWKPIELIKNNTITKQYAISSTVLVNQADMLEPTTPLVKTRSLAGYHVVNVAEQLKIKPEEILKYTNLKIGGSIFQGELIAQKKDFFKKEPTLIQSPTDGIIEQVDQRTGKLIIKITHPTKTVPAGLWGKVESITKDNEKFDIVITSNTIQIKGKAGRGFTREGILQVLTKRFESADPFMITPEHEGKILVVGGTLKDKTLEQAIACKVAGIIVGSMHYYNIKAISKKSDVGISLLIIEGFGEHPINEQTYEALLKQEHYYAIINPQEQMILSAIEPKRNYETQTPSQKTVRIIWGENMGAVGKVIKEHEAVVFPSGIISKGIEIQAGSQTYLVPFTNVEVLE